MFTSEEIQRKRRAIYNPNDNNLPYYDDIKDSDKALGLHDWGCVLHCMTGKMSLVRIILIELINLQI